MITKCFYHSLPKEFVKTVFRDVIKSGPSEPVIGTFRWPGSNLCSPNKEKIGIFKFLPKWVCELVWPVWVSIMPNQVACRTNQVALLVGKCTELTFASFVVLAVQLLKARKTCKEKGAFEVSF